jgi:hypothetical protein
VSDWLVREFTVLGIHFQNWMLVVLAIVLSMILYAWIQEQKRH